MNERRDPYLILGLDYGSSAAAAAIAFARAARRVRGDANARYALEDITWALHQIEQAETQADASLDTFRVPANERVYFAADVADLLPPPRPLERSSQPYGSGRQELEDQACLDELRYGLEATVLAGLEAAVTKPAPPEPVQPPPPVVPRPNHAATASTDSTGTPGWLIALGMVVAFFVTMGVLAAIPGPDPVPEPAAPAAAEPEPAPEPEAEPVPEPQELPQSRPTIERGSEGDDTVDLQERLGLTADGVFGSGTEGAVREFQQANGLPVDGIVGEATWRALGLISDEPTDSQTAGEPEQEREEVSANSTPAGPVAWVETGDCLTYSPSTDEWDPSRCVGHDGTILLARNDADTGDVCPGHTDIWASDDWGVYCVMVVTDRTPSGGHWNIGPVQEGTCLEIDADGRLVAKSECSPGSVPVLTTATSEDGCDVSWSASDYYVWFGATDGSQNYICIDRNDWEAVGLRWLW